MEDDKEFRKKIDEVIDKVAYEILEKIIEPVCGIENIFADIYHATLDDYCPNEEEYKKPVLDRIAERYRVDREMLRRIAVYPIALIALYVVIHEGETDKK